MKHFAKENEVNDQRFVSTMSSSSSSNPPKPVKELKVGPAMELSARNWLDLPRDVTAKILHKVGAIEILLSAQFVCPLWRNISKDPIMWRTVDMSNCSTPYRQKYDLERMCRHAVDRSCGQLEHINIEGIVYDSILKYIAESQSASHIKRVRVAHGVDGLFEVAKLTALEELEITCCRISDDYLEAIGRNCPLLKVLKLNRKRLVMKDVKCDDEAFAIAKTMPNLCYLQLLRNKLTNAGLIAILDGCSRLESLDLRGCFNVDLGSSLRKRCAEQIRELWLPNDYLDEAESSRDD